MHFYTLYSFKCFIHSIKLLDVWERRSGICWTFSISCRKPSTPQNLWIMPKYLVLTSLLGCAVLTCTPVPWRCLSDCTKTEVASNQKFSYDAGVLSSSPSIPPMLEPFSVLFLMTLPPKYFFYLLLTNKKEMSPQSVFRSKYSDDELKN